MLNAGVLTFKEFAMREPLPLATIHEAVLEFLRGRDDIVLFGATAVNAYVDEPRMTQDIDLMSTHAAELAEELRAHLATKFHVAMRVRVIGGGKGYRLFQVQKTGNRHLVDVRPVRSLPQSQTVDEIQVASPPELIARKVISFHARRGQPRAGTDWRDLAILLLTFPELKSKSGAVSDVLEALGVSEEVIKEWHEVVAQQISSPRDEDEFE
ncbi:MAG TPA: nucleotidyl transferase AbiEii/AbiGii toxin family protein [Pyrinomonadaceae bacterium]|nr:nucleotidyl transferase AbiEii/AbiGii toxin family protein [Pyrinomonadaceae bacterium]